MGDLRLEQYFQGLEYLVRVSRRDARQVLLENQSPVAHPYFTEYERIRKICLKILRDEGSSVFDSDSGEINGFLYYLPDLWEDYLEKNMRAALALPDRSAADVFLLSQAEKLGGSSATGTRFIGGNSIPDYVLTRRKAGSKMERLQSTVLILDAKFKPGYETCLQAERLTRFEEDVRKALRDVIAKDAVGFCLVFPIDREWRSETGEGYARYFAAEHYNDMPVYLLPFTVPHCEDGAGFSKWRELLQEQEDRFRSAFLRISEDACVRYERRACAKQAMRLLEKLPRGEWAKALSELARKVEKTDGEEPTA